MNKALKPVDDFIGYLSKIANEATFSKTDKASRVSCVANSVAVWAKAGALTKLDSLNANLSVGGRFAGLAIALLQAEKAGPIDPTVKAEIDPWLLERGQAMRDYFDSRSKMNATKNNLRAWTGLAVGTIGLVVDDPTLLKWGQDSFQLVACQVSPDGSLPLEMGRADRALGYQIHAVSPLVLSAVLFASDTFDGFALCDGALAKIVAFTVAAAKDPTIVEKITGKPQVFLAGDEVKSPFTMAWAEPYLAHVADPDLDAFVAKLRPLSNSKLGGNLTEIYGKSKS